MSDESDQLDTVVKAMGRPVPITRASKVCSHHPCHHLQPCPVHQRKPWEGSTRSAELPSNWERIRRHILQRDPLCKVCDDALSTEVDHIGDKHDHHEDNLQGICGPCHREKTQREAADARRATHR